LREGQGDSVTDDSSVTVAGNGVCYYVLVDPCPANNGNFSWWGAFAKNLFSWKNFTAEFKQEAA
jgi:hypothetical protein